MKSKRSFLVIIICLMMIVPNIASAQYRSFILGIKAAPSISWMTTNQDDYSSEGAKIGFSWGVTSEFYFAKNYALATGLQFLYTGGKLSYPEVKEGVAVSLTRDYRIRFLEIPAVLKLKTNEIGSFKYFGQIGLGFGVRMNSKGEDEYRLNGQTILEDYSDIDSDTRLFRTSMIIGAGVEYPFDNNTSLVAGVNFNNGFTNALKGKNSVNIYNEHRAKTNFIELSLGVMF